MKEVIDGALKKDFRPEFLNRLDEIIIFNQLNEDSILKIVDIMINETMGRLKEKNIFIDYDKDLSKFIAEKNKEKDFGARPLRRIITREIEDKLSDEIIKGDIVDGDKLLIQCNEQGIEFAHK